MFKNIFIGILLLIVIVLGVEVESIKNINYANEGLWYTIALVLILVGVFIAVTDHWNDRDNYFLLTYGSGFIIIVIIVIKNVYMYLF